MSNPFFIRSKTVDTITFTGAADVPSVNGDYIIAGTFNSNNFWTKDGLDSWPRLYYNDGSGGNAWYLEESPGSEDYYYYNSNFNSDHYIGFNAVGEPPVATFSQVNKSFVRQSYNLVPTIFGRMTP